MKQVNGLMDQMQAYMTLVEEELDRRLPLTTAEPSLIHQAMRYSVCGGGKRLRAILALEAAGLRGQPKLRALPVAASMEMIHAYSLIHDDLPCMDDDDFRRGKPTNHRVFGEAMAVLAGDALLTQAFLVLAQLPALVNVSAETALRIVHEVAEAASSVGLVGGQVADVTAGGDSPGASAPELLRSIHERKTGALFRCSLRGGALMGQLDERDMLAVDNYAVQFGLAFQITDDILDVVGDSLSLGKETGSDERKGKLTYPRIYGVDQSRKMAKEAALAAQDSLLRFGDAAGCLIELASYIVQRDH